MMNKAISLASENKILSEMANADTMNTNNYQKDIFYNTGVYFSKT